MKITTKSLCGMLAMLAFCACSSNSDDAESGNDPKVWHVTLQASMEEAAENLRALSEGAGNVITANFAVNDEVVVVDADGSTIVGTLKAKTAGASTTLDGNLNTASLTVGEIVTLHYLGATPNYDGQDGTLAGISSYAKGTLTVSTTSPLTFTTTNVLFAAKQSITKLSFTDGTNAVSVKTFGIAADGLVQSIAADATSTETVGAVTGILTTPSSDVYVALRNNSGSQQTYTFYIKDNDSNWYKGTKKANLANGKNYTASVTLTKLPELSSTDDAGTLGVIGGLPAIVVDFNLSGTIVKKAVALMNTGALCPEAYGTYKVFGLQASELPDGWYVPTSAELEALAGISSTWGAPKGVNGRTFTIGGNTLFLPAAGLDDGDNDPSDYLYVSVWGYYWSSTVSSLYDYLAISLQFNSADCNTNSSYKSDALTVRPFHALE